MKTTGAFSEETHFPLHYFIKDKSPNLNVCVELHCESSLLQNNPHQNNHSAFGRFQHLVWDLRSTHLLHGFTIALSCSCKRQLLCFQPSNLCFWTRDMLIQITCMTCIQLKFMQSLIIQQLFRFSEVFLWILAAFFRRIR